MNPKDIRPAHFVVAVLPVVAYGERPKTKQPKKRGSEERLRQSFVSHRSPAQEEMEVGFFSKEWDDGHIHAGIVQVCGEGCESHMPGIEPEKRIFYIGQYETDLGYVTVLPIGAVVAMDDGGDIDPDDFKELPEVPEK